MAYRWRCLLSLAILAAMGLAAAHLHLDDSLIYSRYIRNALAGHGMVFNWTATGGGEKVNALTSPLYTYLLLAASWLLRGHILLAQWLLGMGFLAATVVLAERYIPFAGIFVAGAIYFEVMLYMETPLYVLLLLLSVVLYAERRWNWLPLALCLLLLARFEGGLLAAAMAWQMLRKREWPRWQAFVPAVAVLGIYLALNFSFYGQALPSSASAKFYHATSGYWGKWPTAFLKYERVTLHPLKVFSVLAPFVLWLGWRGARAERLRRWNPVVLPFCVGLLAFYILANLPGYEWYVAPFVLFALVYAAQGLPHSRIAYGLTAAVLLVTVASGCVGLYHSSNAYSQYRVLAGWINRNTPPGATIASAETGTLGWYCDHPIVDIVGLTTPENARRLARHDPDSWLEADKPDYVVVHQPAMIGEQVALDSPDYVPVGEVLPAETNSNVPRPETYLLKRKAAR
jgi:arabinofuranosyltransferase